MRKIAPNGNSVATPDIDKTSKYQKLKLLFLQKYSLFLNKLTLENVLLFTPVMPLTVYDPMTVALPAGAEAIV